MLDSDLLRTFVAVADTQNFTKAGQIVGRTQSAVSVQMRKLEEMLGETLFDRGSRGVMLTRQGEKLLTRARRVVSLIDEAVQSMKEPGLIGLVRIGIPEEYGSSVLPAALRNFDLLHPGVEVVVSLGPSAKHIAALKAGQLDLAVVYEPGDKTRHEVLKNDATVWVTSRAHDTHLRSPIPVAMYTQEGWYRSQSLASLDRAGYDYRLSYLAEGSTGLIAGVQAGLGIGPLSRSRIPDDCRELTEAEGFSQIDDSNVVLRLPAAPISSATTGMANAIRKAFAF